MLRSVLGDPQFDSAGLGAIESPHEPRADGSQMLEFKVVFLAQTDQHMAAGRGERLGNLALEAWSLQRRCQLSLRLRTDVQTPRHGEMPRVNSHGKGR